MPLSGGEILNNRYRIDRLLGGGGFGNVYRAWDLNLERPRALKENTQASEAAQRQFKREAQMLCDLTHPNLPKVIDHFFIPGEGGQPGAAYLVMEFVEGRDLQEILEERGSPLPEEQALEWMRQVCEALEYLHSQEPPVIHRDIKPANIKITARGRAILVDFGIAKLYDPARPTSTGARAVTPGYTPFEQYGQHPTDARTDIYALGATLYHLLTGQVPVESISRVAGVPLPPPRRLNPAVSPKVEAAMLKAMQVMPEDRYQSVAEFKAALLSPSPSPLVGERPGVRGDTLPVAQAHVSPLPLGEGYGERSSRPGVRGLLRRLPSGWVAVGLVILAFSALLVARALFGDGADGGESGSLTRTTEALALLQQTTAVAPSRTPTRTPTASRTPTPTLTPSPTALPTRLSDEKGVEMALVPAGEFLMGLTDADPDASSNEKPQHRVYLDAFYIDIYEVTNALYRECVEASVCDPLHRDSYYRSTFYDDYPVIWVDWEQARAYCRWRGGDLPTEAQWEKAARGEDGRIYPWGDAFNGHLANFCDTNCPLDWANKSYDDGYADTAPVGSYPEGVSPYGLYDMAGNVWEWVRDWYLDTFYTQSPFMNPLGPSSGEYRVLRGGSWYNNGNRLRVALRLRYEPTYWNVNLGFRCVVSP